MARTRSADPGLARRPLTGRGYSARTSLACAAGRHGNACAYTNDRCRCPEAREDWRRYNKRRREGRHQPLRFVPALATARRLQALAADGWPRPVLAAALGVSVRRLTSLRDTTTGRLHPATAHAVAALYDQLAGSPGP